MSALTANAQQIAGNFDQLRVLVAPGDTLTVTDASGARMQGKLTQLSGSGLVLDVSGVLRQLQDTAVVTIEKRGSDPLKNGALMGLAIGGVLGGLAIGATAEYGDGPAAAYALAGALLYGGIGAGIGAGIDALVEGRRVIYASSNSPTTKLSVRPVFNGTRTGVLFSLRLTH
jgi:hypothetical protein